MTTTTMRIVSAAATRSGTRTYSCDAAEAYETDRGRVGAAVFDGTGNDEALAAFAPTVATVAARVTAHRTSPLAGVLAAAELVAEAPAYAPHHDGVIVTAYADPAEGGPVDRNQDPAPPCFTVAWLGDCGAAGWDGNTVTTYTTPHTVGEQLRQNGAPLDIAAEHDNWLRARLSDATVATVRTVDAAAPLLVLYSDGAKEHMPSADSLAYILGELVPDPLEVKDPERTAVRVAQALLDALVCEVYEGEDYRDDGSVVVLLRCPADS